MKTETKTRLRVLATTDLHGQARAFNYVQNQEASGIGLTRVASLIREARNEEPLSVLFDCGDSLFGNQLTESKGFPTNPIIEAFSALDYSAIALGNHDFDHGQVELNKALSDATFPVLASNFDASNLSGLRDTLIFELEPEPGLVLNVGVLAYLVPSILPDAGGITWSQTAIGDIAKGLRDAKADVVIALVHGDLDVETELAATLAETCDVILEGHVHRAICRSVSGPKGEPRGHVQAGFWGSHLGVVDLDLSHGAAGWTVTGIESNLRSVANLNAPADDEIKGMIVQRHTAVLDYLAEPVGESSERLYSYLSVLGASRILDLVSAAQLARAAELVGAIDLPLLSAVAPQRAGGLAGPDHYVDIPPGILMRRHLSQLYGFPNKLGVVKISGAQVRAWLSEAAKVYCPIRSGVADQDLVNRSVPSYQADRIYGVSYDIDLAQPQAIGTIMINGRPLDLEEQVLVATNDFRMNAGSGFAWLKDAERVVDPTEPIMEILEQALKRGLPVAQPAPFTLRWPEGASAKTRTAPAAEPLLSNWPEYEFTAAEHESSGYLRLHFRPRTPISSR